MFADDTNILTDGNSAAEISEKINSDLDNIHKWLVANKLTLNIDKTEYMIVGSRQRLQQVTDNLLIKIGDHVMKGEPIKN